MRRNLVKDMPRNLRFEVNGILYWYKRACAELMQMGGPATIQDEVDQIQQRFQGVTFEPSGVMLGPIAVTYLSREEYLKKLLKEILDDCNNDEELEKVCYRYDYCHGIDTYLFAIERHRVVLPLMPAGVQLTYEPDVQEALDVLNSFAC